MSIHTFDMAISFAGEEREYAEALAELLFKKYNLKVFYDRYEQANIVGEFLPEYLLDIYKNRTKYCIVLVSINYKNKRYTRHEWRAAQERAFKETGKYLIIIRFDDTELPGLFETLHYFSVKELTVEQIADTIFTMSKSEIEKINRLRRAEEHHRNGEIIEAMAIVENSEFDNDLSALWIRESVLKDLGKEPDRIKILERILELKKESPMAHFILGNCYYRSQDFEKSVMHYEEALKSFPKHPTILATLPSAKKKLEERKNGLF